MKNLIIKIISFSLIFVFILAFLTACGVSVEEAAGTYTGGYIYNEHLFTVAIMLDDEGEYEKFVMKDGALNSYESGDYEIKGSKVVLYDSEASVYHGVMTKYKYKNGTIINNGHIFTKE